MYAGAGFFAYMGMLLQDTTMIGLIKAIRDSSSTEQTTLNAERYAEDDDVHFAITNESHPETVNPDGDYDTNAERLADDPSVVFAVTDEENDHGIVETFAWFVVGYIGAHIAFKTMEKVGERL